jgi:hypothetical protein
MNEYNQEQNLYRLEQASEKEENLTRAWEIEFRTKFSFVNENYFSMKKLIYL